MDTRTDVTVTECPDGPLLVRGNVAVYREDGSQVPTHRRTIALCRCAGSQILPLCDGTHRSLTAQRKAGPAA